jgi:hypothetical protein
MRKSVKGVLGAGVAGGFAFAVWRAFVAQAASRPKGVEWETAPFPFPPVPRSSSFPTAPTPARAAWVEPDDDGSCPTTHPVKAKLSSGIFHVPGGLNYERTKPDRCYLDESAAEADGLRPSKV